MAQRDERSKRAGAPGAKKAIRAGARPAAKGESSGIGAPAALEARCLALERECETLRAELEAARTRVASLEKARTEVVNRIDWIVDSLHSLKQAE
jgi:hypothetical protein